MKAVNGMEEMIDRRERKEERERERLKAFIPPDCFSIVESDKKPGPIFLHCVVLL